MEFMLFQIVVVTFLEEFRYLDMVIRIAEKINFAVFLLAHVHLTLMDRFNHAASNRSISSGYSILY